MSLIDAPPVGGRSESWWALWHALHKRTADPETLAEVRAREGGVRWNLRRSSRLPCGMVVTHEARTRASTHPLPCCTFSRIVAVAWQVKEFLKDDAGVTEAGEVASLAACGGMTLLHQVKARLR